MTLSFGFGGSGNAARPTLFFLPDTKANNYMSEEQQPQTTLIDLADLGVQTSEEMESSEVDALTKASDYLPQLRIYGTENKLVKQKKMAIGVFGLYFSSDNVVDIGEEIHVLVIAARPRASIIDDTPVSYYDMKSADFLRVKDLAMLKEEKHLVGLEYLIWLPSVGKFALFFMGTITLRRESGNVKALIGQGGTFKIKLIEGKKYTWHGCECYQCTAPLDLPEKDALATEVQRFKNPGTGGPELATPEGEGGRQR